MGWILLSMLAACTGTKPDDSDPKDSEDTSVEDSQAEDTADEDCFGMITLNVSVDTDVLDCDNVSCAGDLYVGLFNSTDYIDKNLLAGETVEDVDFGALNEAEVVLDAVRCGDGYVGIYLDINENETPDSGDFVSDAVTHVVISAVPTEADVPFNAMIP